MLQWLVFPLFEELRFLPFNAGSEALQLIAALAFIWFMPLAPVDCFPIPLITDVPIQVNRPSLCFFDALRGVCHLDPLCIAPSVDPEPLPPLKGEWVDGAESGVHLEPRYEYAALIPSGAN